MKVRTQTVAPRAARLFTDREEPRAAFWQNYEQFRQEIARGEANIHVLNYYGIGGIGKSRLLKQLASEMDENLPAPRYVYFDFNVAQERRAVLTALKNKLAERHQFQFPLFDLCSYVYARSVGEDPSSPEVKKLTDSSPVLSLLLSVAENIPIVGIGAKVLSLADQGLATLRSYLKLHQSDLAWLESQDPEDLHAKLPAFFAQDLNHNLESADQPLVLFLDTYERLVNEMSSVGAPLNHDQWLRDANGPVQNTLNTLWVIAGREKLKWAQMDADWEDALETHILGSLSPTDSDRFLCAAGVGGGQLRSELYELTSGTPVYLDLCVDQYLRLTQQGIVPDITMFGQNTYDLIERFVRYMDDTLKDIVYVMAFLERWDDRTLTDIAARVLPNFSLTTYEKVKEFSFVIQSDEDTFNIHQTVGDVLATYCPKALKETIVGCALDHFTDKLKEETVRSADFAGHLRYAMQFGLLQYPEDEKLLEFYQSHASDSIQKLAEAGRLDEANDVFTLFWLRAELSGNSLLFARALWSKSHLLNLSGDLKQSAELAQAAAEQFDALLGPNHPDTLNAACHHASCLCDLGQYEEVLPFYEDLLDKYTVVFVEDHENLAQVKNGLARVYTHLERHEDARKLQEQVLASRQKKHGEDHPDTQDARLALASTLSCLSQYEEALTLEQAVADYHRSIHGEDHPDTLIAVNNMATTLARLSRTEEARALQEQTLEAFRDILGCNHPHTLAAMSNLAVTLSLLSRHEEALDLQKEVLERRQALLGNDHPATKSAIHNLAAIVEQRPSVDMYDDILLQKSGQLGQDYLDDILINVMYSFHLVIDYKYEEAARLLEIFIPIQRAYVGGDDQYSLMALGNLASAYEAAGRKEKALELYLEVMEKSRALLGDDHPDTLSAMFYASSALRKAGRSEEALELSQQHFDKARTHLGEDHRETLRAMHNLATTLHHLKRYKDELPLRKALLEKYRKIDGPDHHETFSATSELASTLRLMGRTEEATKLLRQMLPALTERAKTDDTRYRNYVTRLARLLYEQELYDAALPWFEQAVTYFRETLSETHIFRYVYSGWLADTLEKLSLFSEALPLRKELLAEKQRTLGKDHPNTLSSMRDLANTLNELKQYEEELSVREEILAWHTRNSAEDHPDTLAALHRLAYTLYDLERYEEALVYQLAAAEGRMRVLGEEHPDTLIATHNLAMIHFKLENYSEAQKWMEWTVQQRRKVLGEAAALTLKSMKCLSKILGGAGHTEEQQALDKKIEELKQSAPE